MERQQSGRDAGPSSEPVKPCCQGKKKGGSSGGGGDVIPRPVFGPVEVSKEKLKELTGLFDRSTLAESTRLLEASGQRLRQGASLLFSAAPGGVIMVQGESPVGARLERAESVPWEEWSLLQRLALTTSTSVVVPYHLPHPSLLLFNINPPPPPLAPPPPAISPGKVREQESYLLGSVADERLAAALFGMFLKPDRCLDAGFAHT
jgi:hypothetical protein